MKPIIEHREYLKFGFCRTRFQAFFCPVCKAQLSAGPNFQPRFCDVCGQKIDFSGVEYEKEQHLGYELEREALVNV